MKYTRSILKVSIRLDPVPGWGDNPQDHAKFLKDLLTQMIPHYQPKVLLLGTEEEEVKWND